MWRRRFVSTLVNRETNNQHLVPAKAATGRLRRTAAQFIVAQFIATALNCHGSELPPFSETIR